MVPGLAVEGVQPQREQPELGRLRREKADPQSRLRQTDSPVTRDQSSRYVYPHRDRNTHRQKYTHTL